MLHSLRKLELGRQIGTKSFILPLQGNAIHPDCSVFTAAPSSGTGKLLQRVLKVAAEKRQAGPLVPA